MSNFLYGAYNMMLSKIIHFVKIHQADIILVIGVILISLLSFATGYIVAKTQEKEPLRFEMTNNQFLMSNKILEIRN